MLQLVFGRWCLYRLTQVWTITTLPLAATFVPPGVVWADERQLLHDGLSWCGRGPPWWLPARLPACGYCHDAFVAGIWNHYNLSALEPVRQPLAVQGRAATLHDVQFQRTPQPKRAYEWGRACHVTVPLEALCVSATLASDPWYTAMPELLCNFCAVGGQRCV